ncbi:MAG: hypothetical protein HOM21_14130 [Halobacteriovoraceae bacterium]|mgnify:FL=1|nr:hypothetical protein [Halobacteriovoraceae bacterium]
MNIFLVRHGHSENDRSDFERVLSKKGILEVESLAAKLLEIEQIRPRKIIHSGLYRARETASIIKE